MLRFQWFGNVLRSDLFRSLVLVVMSLVVSGGYDLGFARCVSLVELALDLCQECLIHCYAPVAVFCRRCFARCSNVAAGVYWATTAPYLGRCELRVRNRSRDATDEGEGIMAGGVGGITYRRASYLPRVVAV